MTDTALNTLPDTSARTYGDRARDAAGVAQDRVASAATATADAAKSHPYAAAGIAAGVAAAVAGAAFGATRLRASTTTKAPKTPAKKKAA